MSHIMTDHVFDFTMLLEEERAGRRAGSARRVGSERLWKSAVHGSPLGLKPRAKKQKGKNINHVDSDCALTHMHTLE